MSTQSSPHRAPLLDYDRPRRLVDRIVTRLGPAHLAVAIAIAGYSVAWIETHIARGFWIGDINVLGWLGVAGFVGGTLWYVVLRIWRRRELHWLLRVQLLLATLVGVAGALAVVQRLDESHQKLFNPEFWTKYNQTYRYNRYWVLRPLKVTAIGVTWFVMVLVIGRVLRPPSPTRC